MKVGDLVTVLPAASNMYLVVKCIEASDLLRASREDLGALWELYSEELGIRRMHEKWMEVISEGR